MTMISTSAPNNINSTQLTNPQMNIWRGQMLSPNVPLYNMVMAFHFNGAIDVNRFKSAFQELTNQNDVLRLVLKTDDTLPKQFFLPELESKLEFMDFSGCESPSASYDKWVAENKGKIFFADEVLYHTLLFKLNSDHFIWYFNHHHLITDGVTIHLLYDRLHQNYSQQKEYSDNATPFHYQKIAVQFPYDRPKNQSAYWNELKESLIVAPSLYGNRPVNSSSKSTRISVNLGKERTDKLKVLALTPQFKAWNVDVTLFNIFQTILSALVYKVSGQEEFNTGFASHNRILKSHRHTAGLFMELLPLRVVIEKEDSMISLFEKTKKASFETMKHAGESTPPAELLKSFNTVLNFIPNSFDNFDNIPVSCDWIHSGHSDPGHHIRLQIHDFNNLGDYQLQFDLNDEVILPLQRDIVSSHFVKLLDALIENRDEKLSNIQITTRKELSLMDTWNKTHVEYPEDEVLLSKFEKQARLFPERTALVFESASMTYQMVDEQSNQLAHLLIKRGLRPKDIAVVAIDRSLEMMIAIYAILKAGGTYLPLDTEIPQQRLDYIIEDANPFLILTNSDSLTTSSLLVIDTKDILKNINQEAKSKPVVQVDPGDLAYIIYTSGSTGEPKGVKCHHRGICNRLNWGQDKYPLSELDILIQKTPITFDVSIPELFWPLQMGNKLIIESPNAHKETDLLIKTINDHQVTVIHFVPSMLNAFLNNKEVSLCKSIRQVFSSGEALSVSTVRNFHSKLNCKLSNLYGPTEACVEVASWECTAENSVNSVPIGHVVANTKLYILDKNLNQVPIGKSGDLYIAGTQVAKGYLNKRQLTLDSFVDDVFDRGENNKMYRSGDTARFRNDGAIEYLGRTDYQIKLRGFRIELGEIDSKLSDHVHVNQCVVDLCTAKNDSQYVVAYYTGLETIQSEFVSFLKLSLPDYMIPSFFVRVERFELTSSGKVNRGELPSHHIDDLQETDNYMPPETQMEEIIASVWEKVLQIEQIGIRSGFIQLGGDSLTALIITTRLKEIFELDLPVNLIFTESDIASYAQAVEKIMIQILEDKDE